MDSSLLYSKLSALPEKLKKEVEAFIDQLLSQKNKSSKSINQKKPVFGSAKGMFVMHPDFDEPLDDFKDYMQ